MYPTAPQQMILPSSEITHSLYLKTKQMPLHNTTDRWQWAPGQQRLPWGHTSQPQSHWRRWWRSRRGLQPACGWASGRPAGCHAPDSRAPSRCSPSGHQPGLRGQRCIHARREEEERMNEGRGKGKKYRGEKRGWLCKEGFYTINKCLLFFSSEF